MEIDDDKYELVSKLINSKRAINKIKSYAIEMKAELSHCCACCRQNTKCTEFYFTLSHNLNMIMKIIEGDKDEG